MDPLSVQTGVLSMGMDVNMTVNKAETISMRPVELKLPKPPTRSESGHVDEADGPRNHPSTSSTHTDMYTVGNKTETTENRVEIISMHLIEPKPLDPLTMGANTCTIEPNGCGNHVDMLTGHGESPGIEMDAETSASVIEIVRASPNEPNRQTYLFKAQEVPQTSQTAAGTDQMRQADAWTCTALETMHKWL